MFLLRIHNLFHKIKVKLQSKVTLFNSSNNNNNNNSNKQSCMETTFLNKSSINTNLVIMQLPNHNSNNQHHKLNISKGQLLVELLLIIMETFMSRELKLELNKFQSRLIIKRKLLSNLSSNSRSNLKNICQHLTLNHSKSSKCENRPYQ